MNVKALTISECNVCGSADLTWQTSIVNRSNIQQGRLNTNDVECIFFLGCEHCSETLATVSADKIAGLMNDKQAVSANCNVKKIVMPEMNDPEGLAALAAMNVGHPGSIENR